MSEVAIRKGDRLPQLDRQFTLDGAGIPIVGATVTFNMWYVENDLQSIINGPVTVINAANGTVRYVWTSNDALLDAGIYIASFTATFPDGRRITAPNNGMIIVEIFDEKESNWSYTGSPALRQIDAVRFTVGDTNQNDQLISDNEVQFLLERHGSIIRASSEAARAIAAKFARLMSQSIGGLSADFATKYRHYMELATSLTGKEETEPVSPFISGFSRSAKESVELDTDRETTFARKGITDNNRIYPSDDYYDSSFRNR